jgi:ketosteroid isomerase-like protein
MAREADTVVFNVQAKWAAAFAKLDAEALSSLYSKHALFYGSNPTLYRGRDGVKRYFSGLPRWQSQSVKFADVVTEAVGADVVSMAGTANFAFDKDTLTVKITWVIVREDGDWKIASHHVSSKAPLL